MIPDLITPAPALAIWALAGYLLGSIPFGVLLAHAFGLGNLRNIGSGNIGATNVLRTGNKTAALLTLILDGAKGAVAVLIARSLAAEDAVQIAGLFAFVGHCFPVWLRFRGGKGVATFLGLLLAYAFPLGLAACATWAATAAILRISSLSALVAAVLSPVWALILGLPQAVALTILLAALILIRHRANIARLLRNEEPRIGASRKP
ncbi:glycerol-3-phosphate 1-O-acyltransferase PlsY [Pseudooceanicola sp. C21-150M6]|uniref:glycerol-3-phosphate 1-O-acyltransferase PlsY n=1 Tax=Pseudooceanicola sp. C21-150M6 TaxID=3434355 RepID=UPI003D7FC06E